MCTRIDKLFFFFAPVCRVEVNMLDATVLTTAGLVYTLFHMAEISRIDARAEFAVGFLKKIAVNSLSVLHAGGGHCYLPNGATLSFDASGVCNVYDCLQCHTGIRILSKPHGLI